MAIPKLLTPSETSVALRISIKTLYRWVYERKIPYIKLHGKLLFEEEAISGYVRKSIDPAE
jgi:excisionase family DNA binding protein